MLPKVCIAGVFGVLVGLSVLVGCSTSNYKSNAETLHFETPASVKAEALAMVGKPMGAALERLGPPTSRERIGPPTSSEVERYLYFWNKTTYCGQLVEDLIRESEGVAAAPIQRTACTPTGREAEVEKQVAGSPEVVCTIMVNTDGYETITKFDVMGCANGF